MLRMGLQSRRRDFRLALDFLCAALSARNRIGRRQRGPRLPPPRGQLVEKKPEQKISIVLYDYWRSSASYRVRIALGLAGLEFEPVQVNLLEGEHRSSAYKSRNPQGLVPALVIDGKTLTQSLAIIEYLHETGRGNFLHGSAEDRAMTRAVAQAIAMEIHPVCNLSVARHAAEASGGAIELKSWMTTFIARGLEAVEEMLERFKPGVYCCGDEISIADICLVPQIYNARRWDVDLSQFSRIRKSVRATEKLQAVRAAHPDNFIPNGVTS